MVLENFADFPKFIANFAYNDVKWTYVGWTNTTFFQHNQKQVKKVYKNTLSTRLLF